MHDELHSSDLNIQATIDVRKMAELGWFDTEYTVYGCAYLDDEMTMHYKVSSKESDIYDFIEKSLQIDVYPSNIVSITQKYPVPSGMKDAIANEVKKDLARKMREYYPKDFLQILSQIARTIKSNQAKNLLWEEAEKLEGRFDEEELNRFEAFLHYTYTCQKLRKEEYEKLLKWLEEERSNTNDNFISKDIFEKNMYGIGYKDGEKLKYIYNAQKEYVYRMAYKLEMDSYNIGEIYQKTYWYNNYSYRLSDVIMDYKKELKSVYSLEHIKLIDRIKGVSKKSVKEGYIKKMKEVQTDFGEHAVETMKRYGYHWGIL